MKQIVVKDQVGGYLASFDFAAHSETVNYTAITIAAALQEFPSMSSQILSSL